MKQKLDLKKTLNALDRKDFDFYDRLSEEEKDGFSPYVLMRYSSCVQGSREAQEYFLEMTNEFVNKNFWNLSKNHKELLWKLFALMGTGRDYYHQYLKSPKQETNRIENLLAELHPTMKMSDIKLLAKLMTDKECKALIDSMGEMDKKQRKQYE